MQLNLKWLKKHKCESVCVYKQRVKEEKATVAKQHLLSLDEE